MGQACLGTRTCWKIKGNEIADKLTTKGEERTPDVLEPIIGFRMVFLMSQACLGTRTFWNQWTYETADELAKKGTESTSEWVRSQSTNGSHNSMLRRE